MGLDLEDVGAGIRRITLNHPERGNAWSSSLGAAMSEALRTLRADPGARCVVVTGAGSSFCAGVDLADGFELGPDGVADLRGMHRRSFVPTILDLRALPMPVIVAVNGPAVGFGAALALAGDFTVMADTATLLFAFVRLGLSVDSGTTHVLTARAGRARATEAAMLGEPITAETAVAWGLVHRAVPAGALAGTTDALAERLAAGPTRAYARIKEGLSAAERPALAEQLEVEGELIQTLADTADFAEGVAAFTERRPARFEGR